MAVSVCLALGLLSFVAMTGSRLLLSLYAIELGATLCAAGSAAPAGMGVSRKARIIDINFMAIAQM